MWRRVDALTLAFKAWHENPPVAAAVLPDLGRHGLLGLRHRQRGPDLRRLTAAD
jgi:hypothetical protein